MGLLQTLGKWFEIRKTKKRNDRILWTVDREFRDMTFRCTGGDFKKSTELCAFIALLISEGKMAIKPGEKNFCPDDFSSFAKNAMLIAPKTHQALFGTALVVSCGDHIKAAEFMGFVSFLLLIQRVQLLQKIEEVSDGQQQRRRW